MERRFEIQLDSDMVLNNGNKNYNKNNSVIKMEDFHYTVFRTLPAVHVYLTPLTP